MIATMLAALALGAFSKTPISVASFSSSDSLKSMLSIGIVNSCLSKDTNFLLIEGAERSRLLEEQSFQLSGAVHDSSAIQAGRILGAKQVVVGASSSILGDEIVSLKILDVESGRIVRSSTNAMSSLELDSYQQLVEYTASRVLNGEYWVPSDHGAGFTFGFGNVFYDSRTRAILGDHAFVNVQFDILYREWCLKLKGGVWTTNLAKNHSLDAVAYSTNDKINPVSSSIAIGRVFSPRRDLYATAYTGMNAFFLEYIGTDTAKKHDFPVVYGFTLGTSLDYLFFQPDKNSFFGGDVRFDMGATLTDYARISPELGNSSFFFSISFGVFGYGSRLLK